LNIREIAKRAKVSTATVSRTVNGTPSVDPKLARRVWKVVNQLGYYPNTHARGLVSGRSRTFGIIVSEITNPFFPEIVQSFENIAVQHNYEILLTSTINDPERMKLAVRRMIERRVDGVAVMTFGMEEALTSDPHLRSTPLVFVDQSPDDERSSHLHIDYLHGIRQAIAHLASLSHTRIAFVSGPLNLPSARERHQAFLTAMREQAIRVQPEFVVEGDHTMEGGMRALQHLAAHFPHRVLRPTAVLCSNDMTAIGVMRQAYELGLNIPRDLSVIGFDDIRLARFLIPPLTTVQMSQTRLAELAFHALLSAADPSDDTPAPEHRLETCLIYRRSTGPAPK
jgi:LacI family transcriptional regulator